VRIKVPQIVAEDAFLDPDFYAALADVPNLKAPEILEMEDRGEEVHFRVRYAFDGHLPPAARRVLDPDKITWVNDSVFRRSEHVTEFRMVPEYYENRLTCQGRYRFEAKGPEETEQILEGDLIVRYPIVGPLVERAIISGMRQHLGDEARVIERRFAQG
jgi:hypothetical protein